jgi:hypothetical protein
MVDGNSPMVQVISDNQVFPESPLDAQEYSITVPLSIIDNTVSYYARAAAIWFYDPPASINSALSASLLETSLAITLNSYRHFCGRLSYVVAQPNGGHTKRYRRVQVTYNAPTDLGVQFITAKSPNILADYVPSISMRKSECKIWNVAESSTTDLLPPTRMALSRGTPADAPNFIAQVTTFACGSSAIGIAITHGYADAQGMCTFAKDWASVSRALHTGALLPTLSPVFDPRLLDAAAAGDIDAERPDPTLVEKARRFPCHRYDWYKEVPGQPWPVHTPDDLDPEAVLSMLISFLTIRQMQMATKGNKN